VLAALRERGLVTAQRASRSGRVSGGLPFGPGALHYLLRNRVYVGEVVHKGVAHQGEHAAILERAAFERVQAHLTANATAQRLKAQTGALLTGRIFDSAGHRMSPAHANKRGVRYRYYVSRALAEARADKAGVRPRVPAGEIEHSVLGAMLRVRPLAGVEAEAEAGAVAGLDQEVQAAEAEAREASAALATALPSAWLHSPDALAFIAQHLDHVTVHRDRLVIQLRPLAGDGDAEPIGDGHGVDRPEGALAHEAPSLTLTVPWSWRRTRPTRAVIAPTAPERGLSPPHRRLLKAILQAQGWLSDLASGGVDSVEALAAREEVHPRTVRATLSLAFLAPDLVERALDGDLPAHLGLTTLTRALPPLWEDQRRLWEAPILRG
jgi:hypothetical protein